MQLRNNIVYQQELETICNRDLPFENFQSKKILITGATGLIGSYLTDVFLKLNQIKQLNLQVFALCRNCTSAEELFKDYLSRTDFSILEQDITQSLKMDVDFDYIIHAAGNNHPLAFSTQPVETMKAAVLGTMNLLDYGMGQKNPLKRFLLLSTGEIYGEQMHLLENGCSEEDPGMVNTMNPRSCYPEGKRAAETLCASYGKEYEMDTLVARLSYIYGPTMQKDSSKADIQFLQKALNKEDIILKSAGTQFRSYMYISDAIIAILYILLKGEKNQAYNVADINGGTTIRDFAETTARVTGVRVRFENPDDVEKSGYSSMNREILIADKLYKLGFYGEVPLEEGISKILKLLGE